MVFTFDSYNNKSVKFGDLHFCKKVASEKHCDQETSIIADTLYTLPISLGSASISWVCTGSACSDSHLLANEEIPFPDINFESGKNSAKAI